ncbi:MICOS complex subunit MIC27 isoform 2-T2 [Aulostomus maculatus]
MAAKAVMVAVPTVLGIASIRVYTVSDAPIDGLITREKLNIYNPLPKSAQAQFVPDSPGAIESGLTTVRESILPLVKAVKGACVSVKRGSVNLYHAGEDVYYYLKEPPPEFLPRFGTITMAGLLGMFLARKGSRFRRIAVPLGLMSAGASVCYPAQTVAVFKVTGKKVYAAGQWCSAAVSTLLPSKSQDPVAEEIAASQPQAVTVPHPDSAVLEGAQDAPCQPTSRTTQSSPTVSETEMESSGSVSVSDEPIPAVITATSETVPEISAQQAPTDTHTNLETETPPLSEERPAPIESEGSATSKPTPEDIPVEATLSLEEETGGSVQVDPPLAEEIPSKENPPAPNILDQPSESEPAAKPELAGEPEAAAVEEALIPTHPPSLPEQPATEQSMDLETETPPLSEERPAPIESEGSATSKPTPEDIPVEATLSLEEETEGSVQDEPPSTLELPSTEDPPAQKSSSQPPESESAPEPELVDEPVTAAVEEALIPTHTPPPLEQPVAEHSKGGSGFKPDPSLMDFGQSSPEDEDLYSTRS